MPHFQMMRRTLHLLLLPLALCLAMPAAIAQQEDMPVIEVTFRTFFLHNSTAQYTYFNGNSISRFPTATDALSPALRYSGTGPLLVFAGTPDPELPLEAQAVLSIPLSEQMRQITLICSDNASALRCLTINSNPDSIRPGSFCFINATTNTVVGVLDKKRLTVQPGQYSILSPGVSEDSREMIRMAYQHNNEWELFYSSMWTVSAEKRTIIIIYNTADTGQLTVRGVNLR